MEADEARFYGLLINSHQNNLIGIYLREFRLKNLGGGGGDGWSVFSQEILLKMALTLNRIGWRNVVIPQRYYSNTDE